MSEFNQPTIGQLKKAVEIAEKISKLEAELAALLGTKAPSKGKSAASAVAASAAPVAKKKGKGRKKRELSPEAREKIAAAQRARWAKAKKKA